MLKRAALVFILLLSAVCRSQETRIDSLLYNLKNADEDTITVGLLNDISWYYLNTGSYDSAFNYADSAGKLALKLSGKFKTGWQSGLASSRNRMGVICFNQGNYLRGLQNYFEALKVLAKVNDKKTMASVYNGIGNIYAVQKNYEQALRNHLLALQIRKDIGYEKGMANSYGNIGNVYFTMAKYEKALEYYGYCLKLMEATKNKQGLANVYGNFGIVYLEQKKFEEALQCQFKALIIHEEIGDKQGYEITLLNIAAIHQKQGHYAEAERYALQALKGANEIGDRETLKDIHRVLSEAYEGLGNYKLSLENYTKHIVLRDSMNNEDNTKRTVRLEMNYEFEKKEAAAKLDQEKKEAVAAAEKRKQRIILFAISGFGLLVLGFAIFAYRSFLQKRRANIEISRQKELIEEKQKEILDSIHYARRIQNALLTSERYISRTLKKLS